MDNGAYKRVNWAEITGTVTRKWGKKLAIS